MAQRLVYPKYVLVCSNCLLYFFSFSTTSKGFKGATGVEGDEGNQGRAGFPGEDVSHHWSFAHSYH